MALLWENMQFRRAGFPWGYPGPERSILAPDAGKKPKGAATDDIHLGGENIHPENHQSASFI